MADDVIEKKIKFYTGYDKKARTAIDNLNLYLLRDYCDRDYLMKMAEFCKNNPISEKPFIFCDSKHSFIDTLAEMLDKIGEDSISMYFIEAFQESKINYVKDLYVGDSTSKISRQSGDFHIFIPDGNRNSNLTYAILTHELTHYLLKRVDRKEDAFEYSEALSIFFEYLMYKEASKNGKTFFLNNRLSLLSNNCSDLTDDLHYALNPEILGIDSKIYEGVIASNNCYLESAEYALQLIERAKDDKKAVYSLIGDILEGKSTCVKATQKLDIDTSNYKQLRKVIKKQQC